MDVEALGISSAFTPRHDVRCAQEFGVGDTGEGTASLPLVHQAGTENILADTLNDQAFGLGGGGQLIRPLMKGLEGRIREPGGQLVKPRQDGVERGERGEGVAGDAGPLNSTDGSANSVMTPGWSRARYQGPWAFAAASQRVPWAVVDPKAAQPSPSPSTRRYPCCHAALWHSSRMTKG